jgi:hypothetical protein
VALSGNEHDRDLERLVDVVFVRQRRCRQQR